MNSKNSSKREKNSTFMISPSRSSIVAKERGAYLIFVQVDAEDTPAIRPYESLGQREDVHQFDIPV
jgi:hypothetical protein